MVVQRDDLARTDVADELRAHDAERAGFAADDVSVADLADAQGLDAVLVTGGVDAVLRHDHEGVAALHHIQGLHDVHDTVLARALLDEVRQEFRVGVGLEDGAALFQVFSDLLGIHQVTVAGDAEVAGMVAEEERAHVVQAAPGGVRVLDAADAQGTLELAHLSVVENLVQEAQAAVAMRVAVRVEGSDAAAFLAAVLEVVETVVDVGRGVRNAVNSKYTHIILPFPLRFSISPGRCRRKRPYPRGPGGSGPCPSAPPSPRPTSGRCRG